MSGRWGCAASRVSPRRGRVRPRASLESSQVLGAGDVTLMSGPLGLAGRELV